ncbi:MAG: hypothetical protein R3F61_21120 [Myxococcota bacterium]
MRQPDARRRRDVRRRQPGARRRLRRVLSGGARLQLRQQRAAHHPERV